MGTSCSLPWRFQAAYQAASPLNLQDPNPGYAGQYLTGCTGRDQLFLPSGTNLFNPNYRSPRSVVMNIGIQRELHPGMVLSVDFIRNVQTHFLLGVDQNHAGDIRYFNAGAAADCDRNYNCQLRERSRKWRGRNLFG